MEYMSEEIQERIRKWSYVNDKVFPVLIPGKKAQMKDVVWCKWQDLAVCYVIRVPQGEGYFQFVITGQMLEEWGIKQPDIQEQAMKNMRRDGYRVARIQEMLKEIMQNLNGQEDMDEFIEAMTSKEWSSRYDFDNMNDMLVATNRFMRYGASVVLDVELLKKAAGENSMYILPSSYHEVLLLPARKGIKKKDLEDMVQDLDRSKVQMEDRLSDHVYYYNAREGRVEM